MYPRINGSYFFRGILAVPMRSDFLVELGITGVILRSVGRELILKIAVACMRGKIQLKYKPTSITTQSHVNRIR